MLEVNKRLSRKVQLKEDMAAYYLEKIADLESVIDQLREQKQQTIEEKVVSLTEMVNATEKRVAQLMEQLEAFEEAEAQNCEASDNDDEVASSALSDEVKWLEDEISMVKTTMELEESKHRLRILELEEGRDSLRKDITELERQLKERQSKLRDTQAQCESLRMQLNSTRNERENSALSQIEDRRRRAEKLIVRQREMISKLKEDLQRSETENKLKVNEYMAEMKKKYFNQDRVNKLLVERERVYSRRMQNLLINYKFVKELSWIGTVKL
ncbi:unnamed protein product [Trichobilharzia szidati]|nr:unnamed protein product [Trichobilharzia szidati]